MVGLCMADTTEFLRGGRKDSVVYFDLYKSTAFFGIATVAPKPKSGHINTGHIQFINVLGQTFIEGLLMFRKKFGFGMMSCFLMAMFLLQACNLSVGFGIVSIDIALDDDTASRSVSPRTGLPVMEPTEYRISFTGDSSATDIITDATADIQKILKPGNWTINVEALDDAGRVLAKGNSGLIAVTSGASVDVAINLTAVVEGTGSVDITLSWPAASATMPLITRAEVERGGVSVAASAITLEPVGTPPSLRYTESLAAGSYDIVIRLFYGTGGSTTYDEAVQIFANMPSSTTITLPEERFTGLPAAPTGLSAVEATGGINLSWNDASTIETGYRIERTVGSTTTTQDLDANTTSWVDGDVTTGTTYTYSLVAVNGTGVSTAVTTSITTVQASGTTSISIVLIQPSELPMTLDITEGQVVTGATLSVSVSQSYSNYSWRLDGNEIIAAQNLSNATIDCAAAGPGAHRLSLYVTDNGKLYSTAVDFRIDN